MCFSMKAHNSLNIHQSRSMHASPPSRAHIVLSFIPLTPPLSKPLLHELTSIYIPLSLLQVSSGTVLLSLLLVLPVICNPLRRE